MPSLYGERIGVAFDMQGCPNRCRHCWLGHGSGRTIFEDDVRRCVSRFRSFLDKGSTSVRKLSVATSFREPDYRDDYRKMYDLAAELGDGRPDRYELLSSWRLARDETYARWACSVGSDTCQISFFGMRETNDWFHQRNGAFDDAIAATERLLDERMKPRWQLFLTTKLLPELDALLDLVGKLRLRERVGELGSEFQVFLNLPSPDGEGRRIEELRPTIDQVSDLPEAILLPTRKHFGRNVLWSAESALFREITEGAGTRTGFEDLPEMLWFFVCGNMDVYSNIGTLEPWWCLGNLEKNPVELTIRRFESDDVPGLRVMLHETDAGLAWGHGDQGGRRIYTDRSELLSLYRARHCEAEWNVSHPEG